MNHTSSCSVSQSITHGRRMDGSGHRESQMNSQVLEIRFTMPFTCSTGLVMPSIACTTSGLLTASCSIVIVSQVMGDTTSTQGHSGARFKTSPKCQRKQGQESCVLSSIRSQCHSRMKSKYKKVKLHQFFRFHQIWSAETEMFNISLRQSAGMPMPLGAGFAKILLAAQFDGSPRPRLLRSLLWPVGVIFGYWTVIWLSFLLLFVRAAEPNPPVLSGQRASIQSEHYWGRVCRMRHGELTGALPLRSAGTVHGVKGPLPLLLQSFSGSKTAGHRT